MGRYNIAVELPRSTRCRWRIELKRDMQHTFGVPSRHWKPAATEYREHGFVFWEHVCLELGYSLVSRNAGEMLQQPACDAPACQLLRQ